MATESTTIKLSTAPKLIDPNKVIIVGVDEEVNEANRKFFDPAVNARALYTSTLFAQASAAAATEWNNLCESIGETGVQIPICVMEVKDGDTQKVYVVYGRRRVLALRKMNVEQKLDRQIPYVTPPTGLVKDPTVLMRLENSARLGYSASQQVFMAVTLTQQNVKKDSIAAQIGCSTNHVDVLLRIGRSISELLHYLDNDDYQNNSALIMAEIKKLADFWEQPDAQRAILKLYQRLKVLNFCSSRRVSPSQFATDFCQNIKVLSKTDSDPNYMLGYEVVKAEWEGRIKEWIGDTTEESEVPTIDSNLDTKASSVTSPTEVVNSSVPTEEKKEEKTEEKKTEDEVISRVVNATTRPSRRALDILMETDPERFKALTKKEMPSDGSYFEGLTKSMQEMLAWIHLGQLPSARRDKTTGAKDDNTGLCDFLVYQYPEAAKHLKG